MNRREKLAVLIPVFDAGAHLLRTVQSCAGAGLSHEQYELIVVDNCSADGAPQQLPSFDAGGARIHLFRNEANIGRVPNWNRAVELALELGFGYITFLFSGDCWLPGDALLQMLNLMRSCDARAGFAPFVVTDGEGKFKYESRRFYVEGDYKVCGPRPFLTTVLESGMFPFGPLQANVYRIDPASYPVFDPAEPTRTDVKATLEFVYTSASPVLIVSRPILQWREHAGRFHASMGTAGTIRDYMEIFQGACARTQLPINHRRAKARVVLNSLRLMLQDAPPRQWPRLLLITAGCVVSTPHPFSPFHFLETLWLRFALGRRLLQFG